MASRPKERLKFPKERGQGPPSPSPSQSQSPVLSPHGLDEIASTRVALGSSGHPPTCVRTSNTNHHEGVIRATHRPEVDPRNDSSFLYERTSVGAPRRSTRSCSSRSSTPPSSQEEIHKCRHLAAKLTIKVMNSPPPSGRVSLMEFLPEFDLLGFSHHAQINGLFHFSIFLSFPPQPFYLPSPAASFATLGEILCFLFTRGSHLFPSKDAAPSPSAIGRLSPLEWDLVSHTLVPIAQLRGNELLKGHPAFWTPDRLAGIFLEIWAHKHHKPPKTFLSSLEKASSQIIPSTGWWDAIKASTLKPFLLSLSRRKSFRPPSSSSSAKQLFRVIRNMMAHPDGVDSKLLSSQILETCFKLFPQLMPSIFRCSVKCGGVWSHDEVDGFTFRWQPAPRPPRPSSSSSSSSLH